MVVKNIFLATILSILASFCYAQGEIKTEAKIQLSEAEFIYSLTDYTKDLVFMNAYNFVLNSYNPDREDFLTVLMNKLSELEPNYKLSSFLSKTRFQNRITNSSTNQDVVTILRDEIKKAKTKTIQVLKKRIESNYKVSSFFGFLFDDLEVEIKELPRKNTYQFSINKDVDRSYLIKLLQSRAESGYWETYQLSEIWHYLESANNKSKEKSISELINKESEEQESSLFGVLHPNVSGDGQIIMGDVVGYSNIKDTGQINKYLSIPEIKKMFPESLRFMWEAKPDSYKKDIIQLIAAKATYKSGLPAMNTDYNEDVTVIKSDRRFELRIKMNEEGSKMWYIITKNNIGRHIAFVINNKVIFNPVVNSAIEGGVTETSDIFSEAEAKYFAALLNTGSMPKIRVKVVE